ncbi:uncharacterized protein Pyn_05817 [Prunus yedoensis var. nudiflora]|uniref:Uncharacterized protein n=1 Tax=Prunus yedoensis var. nudiflora TaxID=2094558 RepID=A0A314Z5D0_PRUYE|nr:uncharacterized protein Pyn_05817 [Prunus yedoensis var. nudiflora]
MSKTEHRLGFCQPVDYLRDYLPIISERRPHDLDDGCEGDDDFDDDVGDVDGNIDDVDYRNDAFSDAIDVFSLSEAIDIVEKEAQKEHEIS